MRLRLTQDLRVVSEVGENGLERVGSGTCRPRPSANSHRQRAAAAVRVVRRSKNTSGGLGRVSNSVLLSLTGSRPEHGAQTQSAPQVMK